MKNKIGKIILACVVVLSSSITTYAKGNVLDFGEAYINAATHEEGELGEASFANIVPENSPSPYIDSNGTFDVKINSVGYSITSDKFKVSDTSCKLTMDAGAGSGAGSEYYVTLMKVGKVVDTKVKKVTYYTGGIYEYTFTGLSTSNQYYLVIDSNNTTLNCFGTISNYVSLDD